MRQLDDVIRAGTVSFAAFALAMLVALLLAGCSWDAVAGLALKDGPVALRCTAQEKTLVEQAIRDGKAHDAFGEALSAIDAIVSGIGCVRTVAGDIRDAVKGEAVAASPRDGWRSPWPLLAGPIMPSRPPPLTKPQARRLLLAERLAKQLGFWK
jgi:hypothetical protein